jgi:glycosyltransferase involved in cell wall biosynthesis
LTSTPLTVRGGSGTYVGITVLARALEELGHEIVTISPEPGPMPLGHAAQRVGFNLGAGQRLGAVSAVDGVIGFDLDGCLLRHRVPFVASIKGVLAEELTFERGVVRFSLWVQSRCELLNVRRAPLVLTTTEYARGRIARNYGVSPSKIAVVPELIDLEHWRAALAAAGPRCEWTPTILTVCHLYPRKSVDVLLRAMPRVLVAVPGARLRVVGIGPEEEKLAHLRRDLRLEQSVDFLGHIPFEQLTREYRDCALFCLPSRQEGFGIVFLEAMSAGRAVVACHAAAIPEVVPDGIAGKLVAPGDADALATALIALLRDRERTEVLGRQGAEHVERYDAPRVAARFLEAIRGVVGRGSVRA